MTTIRERRQRDALAQLNRAIEQRDAAISKLVKLEVRIKALRRQVQRYEKLAAQPKPEAPKVETVKPLPPALVEEYRATADLDDIPTFLRRKKEGERKDAEAKAQIAAEQAERKRAKTRGRIETMKAKQRGDTKRMPLTGKEALEAIRRT